MCIENTMGKRNSIILVDKMSTKFKDLLTDGAPEAMEAEYANQNKVTQILFEKYRADKRSQVKYVVKWADTIMLNEYANTHIESYKSMGYTPIKKVTFGNSYTKVTWAPRAEPVINLKKLPNWDRLIADYYLNKIKNKV